MRRAATPEAAAIDVGAVVEELAAVELTHELEGHEVAPAAQGPSLRDPA